MQLHIEWVRDQRNILIKRFLDRHFTNAYFETRFSRDISDINFKFLTRDLSILLIAPVDLAHYAAMLRALKEKGADDCLAKFGHLITEEVEKVLRKYAT